MEKPFALFGHSIGALIALNWRVSCTNSRGSNLFISLSRLNARHGKVPPIGQLSDAALIEVLDRHEGTPRMLPGGHFLLTPGQSCLGSHLLVGQPGPWSLTAGWGARVHDAIESLLPDPSVIFRKRIKVHCADYLKQCTSPCTARRPATVSCIDHWSAACEKSRQLRKI